MIRAFKQEERESGDMAALYPRQKLPEGYQRPKTKPKLSPGLFDLLKSDAESGEPKSGAGAAFATAMAVQKASIANGEVKPTTLAKFLTHWRMLAMVKNADQDALTRRVDAVLKRVKMQGFKQASMARTWRIKSFWLVLVLFLLAIVIYEIVKNVKDYQNSPITTKFSLKTPDALDFPQIYLCYGSGYNRSYMMLHKEKIDVVLAYRNRNAVTNKKKSRTKRDLSQIFSHGQDDRTTLSDLEDVRRVLIASADHSRNDQEENQWISGIDSHDGDTEHEAHESDQVLDFGRVKRDALGAGNISANATKAAAEAAKARARAQKRIDDALNAPNISDIVYDFMYQAGFKIEETFLECEFNGLYRQKLDCKQIIRTILDANYGMCYLVTLPEDMKQTVAGQGLRLVLNSHKNLYPGSIAEAAPYYAGVFVSVDKHFDPFNWHKSLALAGSLTKIDLDATYVELLNLDSGPLIQPCVEDDAGRDLLKIYKANYSRTLCQMDCLAQAQRNTCQCIVPIDRSLVQEAVINDTKFCGPKQVNACLANSADIAEKLTTECRLKCHTPCKSYRYEMRSSSAKLYEPAFSHLSLPPNVTSKQLVELRVAFGRKEIAQLIQQPSASFADLVSNLGGQINLWMGASMISLLQMAFSGIGYFLWRLYMNVHTAVKGDQH